MPAYIKLPDIAGEVNDDDHKEWIEVQSVSLPIMRSIQPGARGAKRSNGETTLGDLSVFKLSDSSTPSIAKAVADGKFMDEVVIHLCSTINDKNVTNLELKLANVVLSSYSFSANGEQSPPPSDSLTMNYTKCEWNYMKYDEMGKEAGNFPATYDTEKSRS